MTKPFSTYAGIAKEPQRQHLPPQIRHRYTAPIMSTRLHLRRLIPGAVIVRKSPYLTEAVAPIDVDVLARVFTWGFDGEGWGV